MRLKKDQIQIIAQKILKNLQAKKLIVLKASEAAVFERVQKAITDNMLAEDRLDDEVKKIMDKFRPQISAGQLNEHEVFQRIKKQLVKDRKLVI